MAKRTPQTRKTSRSAPGRWYVCSGESPIALADGPGRFLVRSSKVSTIGVEVYNANDQVNAKVIGPGGAIDIDIKSVLFLKPSLHSGTAEGVFFKIKKRGSKK